MDLKREDASRFAFLLAIPVILVAAGYELLNVSVSAMQVDWTALFTVTAVSFISAWLTIHWFLKLVERTGMLPYVIYRCSWALCYSRCFCSSFLKKNLIDGHLHPTGKPVILLRQCDDREQFPILRLTHALAESRAGMECTQYSQALATETAI